MVFLRPDLQPETTYSAFTKLEDVLRLLGHKTCLKSIVYLEDAPEMRCLIAGVPLANKRLAK